ncbi:MAG: cyclic nucleotide-binding domain-containing protein [Myxococcales bacterium]|nr:cyclic nucleotide-binding domain-containing protein [Myxococcales bacterium]
MHGSDDHSPAPPPPPVVTSQPDPVPALPARARSSTARGGSGQVQAERIASVHNWLAKPAAAPTTQAPTAAAQPPVRPSDGVQAGAEATPPRVSRPGRIRRDSSGFYANFDGTELQAEASSPFAGTALDRDTGLGRPPATPSPSARPWTSLGTGTRPPTWPGADGRPATAPGLPSSPATSPGFAWRHAATEAHLSNALSSLPIERPRVGSAHGVTLTPVAGFGSRSGAEPAAALLALPDIPAHATTIDPTDADFRLAVEALFPGEQVAQADVAHLAARMWRTAAAAGQSLFEQGEAADCAFIVATGLGRVCVAAATGAVALSSLRTGDLIGVAALCGESAHSESAAAASDITLLAFDRREFEKLCAEAPRLSNRLLSAAIAQTCKRVRGQAGRMVQYAKLELGDNPEPSAPSAAAPVSRIGRLFARLAGTRGQE